jgi:hypothetical protein
MKKSIVSFLLLLSLVVAQAAVPKTADAKTSSKNIIIAKVQGNTLYYHKAVSTSKILKNADWQNTVGTGKKQKITLSKSAKFYLISDYSTLKVKKVSKTTFKKNLFSYQKEKEQGVTYYSGMACKMTIKNGKCVKLVQKYQS